MLIIMHAQIAKYRSTSANTTTRYNVKDSYLHRAYKTYASQQNNMDMDCVS